MACLSVDGYEPTDDNLISIKKGYFSRGHSPTTTKPRPIKIMTGEDHLATTTALSRPRSFTASLPFKLHFAVHIYLVNSSLRSIRTPI